MAKQTQQLVTTGLGSSTLGLGSMFALFPGFMNRSAGFNLQAGAESNLIIRILGMRDITFGIGLLLTRNDEKPSALWRKLLAFNAVTDLVLFGLLLPRSKNKLKTLGAMATSGIVTVFCLKEF